MGGNLKDDLCCIKAHGCWALCQQELFINLRLKAMPAYFSRQAWLCPEVAKSSLLPHPEASARAPGWRPSSLSSHPCKFLLVNGSRVLDLSRNLTCPWRPRGGFLKGGSGEMAERSSAEVSLALLTLGHLWLSWVYLTICKGDHLHFQRSHKELER